MILPAIGSKWRVQHKDGWTGTLEVMDRDERDGFSSSHACGVNVRISFYIVQDSQTPDGKYVEDPWVMELAELTVLEKIQ